MKLKDCVKNQKIALSINADGSFQWNYDPNALEVCVSVIGTHDGTPDRIFCYFEEEPPQIIKDRFNNLISDGQKIVTSLLLQNEYKGKYLFAIHDNVDVLSLEENMKKSTEDNIKTLKEIKSGSKVTIPYGRSDNHHYFTSSLREDTIDLTVFASETKPRSCYVVFEKEPDMQFRNYYGSMLIIPDIDRATFKIPAKFKYGIGISNNIQCKLISSASSTTSMAPILLGLLGVGALLSQSNKIVSEDKNNVQQ